MKLLIHSLEIILPIQIQPDNINNYIKLIRIAKITVPLLCIIEVVESASGYIYARIS